MQELYTKAVMGIGDNMAASAMAQYLRQNKNFDFPSGSVTEWVDQVALGMGLTLLPKERTNIIKSIEVQVYGIQSRSKDV